MCCWILSCLWFPHDGFVWLALFFAVKSKKNNAHKFRGSVLKLLWAHCEALTIVLIKLKSLSARSRYHNCLFCFTTSWLFWIKMLTKIPMQHYKISIIVFSFYIFFYAVTRESKVFTLGYLYNTEYLAYVNSLHLMRSFLNGMHFN